MYVRARSVTMAVLLAGTLLAACSDSGSDVPPLPPGWTVFHPAGETRCSDGSPYAYFASPGSQSKLLVEFQGGGACWDALTCAFPYPKYPSGVYLGDVDVAATLAILEGGQGIYDRSNPANPFRDWYHVFVPYCTGDAHYGDNAKTYSLDGKEFVIEHKGRVNARAAIDWVFGAFRDPETAVVTGCSAGALGSIAWAPYVMQHYPRAEHRHFADSFVGVLTEQLYEEAFPNWNAYGVFASFIPGFAHGQLDEYRPDFAAYIYAQTALYFPQHRFSQYDSNFDRTQTAFYVLGGGQGGASEWSRQMRGLISDIHAQVSNFDSYIGAGSDHCFIPYDRFYDLVTDGVALDEWVSGIAGGRPVQTRVDCEPNCGEPYGSGEERIVDLPR